MLPIVFFRLLLCCLCGWGCGVDSSQIPSFTNFFSQSIFDSCLSESSIAQLSKKKGGRVRFEPAAQTASRTWPYNLQVSLGRNKTNKGGHSLRGTTSTQVTLLRKKINWLLRLALPSVPHARFISRVEHVSLGMLLGLKQTHKRNKHTQNISQSKGLGDQGPGIPATTTTNTSSQMNSD